MRNWMFIKQYQDLREHLLKTFDLRTLGDFDRGAFEGIPDEVVSVSLTAFWDISPHDTPNVAIQPTPLDDTTRDNMRTPRKRAAVLAHVGCFEFQVDALRGIEGWPLVYWWTNKLLKDYSKSIKVADVCEIKNGLKTGNDSRFLRRWPEVKLSRLRLDTRWNEPCSHDWSPYVKGAEGNEYFEPVQYAISWARNGLLIKEFQNCNISTRLRDPSIYWRHAASFTTIGSRFGARVVRFASIPGEVGPVILGAHPYDICASLNSKFAASVVTSLNPTVHFNQYDVLRVSLKTSGLGQKIYEYLESSFSTHEAARENSVEFQRPAPSCWEYAQEWAQRAVDREEGEELPEWEPVYDDPTVEQWVSWGVGVALGRFDEEEGLVDEAPEGALEAGILFLSEATEEDSLRDEATSLLRAKWATHGAAINEANSTKSTEDLRTWLRKRFFGDVHRQMYENAPIYFPVSSKKKSFVAFISIHRWTPDTLRVLLADHLMPERQRIEGQRDDLLATPEDDRSRSDQKYMDNLLKWLDELHEFIAMVEQCAEHGPTSPDSKTPEREVNAQYIPVLDDGTMINAAGLWPLLDPQWKYPKKWWKQLAQAKGRKDYDWSMLAARYFPTRVDEKCQTDPSLAVAHGCFWKYHAPRAYAWELRLQNEIDSEFLLDEKRSDFYRKEFLKNSPVKAQELRETEELRWEQHLAKLEEQETNTVTSDKSYQNRNLYLIRINRHWNQDTVVEKLRRYSILMSKERLSLLESDLDEITNIETMAFTSIYNITKKALMEDTYKHERLETFIQDAALEE